MLGKPQSGRKYLYSIYLKKDISRTGKELVEINKKIKSNRKMGKILEQISFKKKDIQMANERMKRGSTWLIFRKMQIKKSHWDTTRMVKMKETDNMKSWPGSTVTRAFRYCWWASKLDNHFGTLLILLLKLNIFISYDPSIPLLGIYATEMHTQI